MVMLLEKQEVLLQMAQRALAYARVYAEGDAELAARVDGISLLRSARRTQKMESSDSGAPAPHAEPPRRRGRPRRDERAAGVLDLAVAERAVS
jgi:hypothetical protein